MKKTFKQFGLAVVIAAIALNAMLITGCNDDPANSPTDLHSDGKYDAIYLKANRWGDAGTGGENWDSGDQIKLSDFTTVKPKEGDILRFKISGVSDKELKNFQIELWNANSDWLGLSDRVVLSKTFNDNIFDIYIVYIGEPKPDSDIIVQLRNALWHMESGEYLFNSGETLGDTPNGTVMATISNFSISVVKGDDNYVEETPPEFLYEENENSITITDYLGDGGNVTIPEQINGKPVTGIGGHTSHYYSPDGEGDGFYGAFEGRHDITVVTIPNSVTNIGNRAFQYCSSLTNVTIGNSVTNIGNRAFFYCTSLNSVTIGNSVTNIGNSAFSSCTSLNSVTIPNSVTSIEQEAFSRCTSLISITIGNSVTSIGKEAFSWCTSLTSVTIPASVNSIEQQAFYQCTILTSVTFQGTIASGNFSQVTAFGGDLRAKYLAGGIGTYTTTAPVDRFDSVWTKQE